MAKRLIRMCRTSMSSTSGDFGDVQNGQKADLDVQDIDVQHIR